MQGLAQELHEVLVKMSGSKNSKVFLKLLSNMEKIKTLADFQDSFTIGGFYKLLSDHQAILKPDQLKMLIKGFKKDIWDTISPKLSAAQKELDVLKQLITFLRSVTDCRTVIFQLQLTEFCTSKVSVQKFVTNILNLEEPHTVELIILKSLTEEIKDQTTLFFIDKFIEVLYSYSFPPMPQIDGDVMTLKGKLVIMSEVMPEVRKRKTEAIQELRILGADVVFINESLQNQQWAGLNVLLVAKTVHVQGKPVWNLSGVDAKNHPSKAADGASPGDDGKHGKHGLCGQSGGNVYIHCTNMTSSANLSIVSNGGGGGAGQPGGNGAKGRDGRGVHLSEFESLISPPEPKYQTTLALLKITAYSTIDFNLIKEVEQLQRDRSLPNIPLPKLCQAVKLFDITWSKAQFRLNVWNTGPSYFTGSTEDQCNITYSYYPHYIPSKQEVSVLYEGTLAQIGGQAGKGGAEGVGGFPGEINIKCGHATEVCVEKEPGANGKDGPNGQNGYPGRNGWDMAFAFVNGWFSSTRKIIGRNQDCKLTLKFHDNRKDDDFVYCPYSNNYIEIKSRSSNINVYERKHESQQNKEDQEQVKATKSKVICRSVIAEEVENISNDVVEELVDLAFDLEDLKEQALEEIVEKDEEKETEMTNFQVQRQAVFDDSALLRQRKLLRKRQKQVTHKTSNSYVRRIIDNPTNIQLWLGLKSIVVNMLDLTKLFNLLFSKKSEFSNSNYSNIYNLLLSKYKIAVCEQIDKTKRLPEVEVYFDPQPIENFLVVEPNSREFTNDDLGTLQEYFRPGHEKLLPDLQKYLQNVDVRQIIYPLKFFIMEKSHSDVSFKHNSKLVLEKLNTLESRLERLIKCYLVAYEKDNTSSMLLAIERRTKEIIETFIDGTDYEFIRTQFVEHVEKAGISSTAVRELLSCAFNANIKIYIMNHNKELTLYHNHNPTSKNVLHLFLVNGQLVECRVDDKYIHLITERKKLSKNYSDILSYVNEFVCKKQFDDFFNNFDSFHGNESKNINYLAYSKLSNDDIIAKICAYFSPDDSNTIKPVLNKLKSDIIQNKNILLSLLQRFDIDGVHISTYELIFITSSILRSFTKQSVNLEMFEWILSINPQSTWLNDIYYLELENYFKKSLRSTSIPRYLTTVKQKDIILLMDIKLHEATDSINLKCISSCLEVLSEIEVDEELVRTLPLSKWQYTLREQLLEYRLCCITQWESNDQLQKALYYINCLESNIGSDIINKLLGLLDVYKEETTSHIILDTLSSLYVQEWSLDDELLNKLSTYGIKYIRKELEHIQSKMEEERSLETLLKLIENNSNTSHQIKQALNSFQHHPFFRLQMKHPCPEARIKEWSEQFKQHINSLNETDKKVYIEQHTTEILTMILHAIKQRKGFLLRTTQRLATLLLLTHNHNTLSQISTGEGKSLIVVAVSIFKALCGEKVDIITSSSVLAVRDATIHEDIYQLFNISVSHNCFDALDKRRDAYSASQVIFGELSGFQRDYLLDRFYGMNIFGKRTFDTLMVDEVDSMFLDKGNNTLYLSHEIPGLDKLESVYLFLWKRICMSAGTKIENFDKHLKQEVLFDLYGTLYVDDLESYLGIAKPGALAIYNFLKYINVIDQNHRVITKISNDDAAKFPEQHKALIHKVRYIINKILKRNREIRIPECLNKFVERHIDVWIKNGLLAIVMEEGIDYVVDVDRTQTKADINPIITIIDKGTGTDQSNSQWDEALHQFLQLKHGCKVTSQSLKAVFISNVSYFKKYTKLFGLTGTLGSHVERDLLQDLYQVQFATIPTAKPKKFIEHEPILCCTKTDWSFRIVNRATELTKANRSVLVICETIKEVNTLAKAFQQANIPCKKIYKREYEECLLAQGKEELDGGYIILATNLAGRGTDIKITDALNKNGGLCVLLAYFPANSRIVQQAFGRAGRCGCNGSGQMVIIGYGSFMDKREQRETEERQRIADIKVFFDTRIKIEESYFERFSKVYKKCNSTLFTGKNLREIASQRLLDRWAFWIDEYGSKLSDSTTEKKFDEFKNNIIDSFSNWKKWTEDPIQLVKVGLNFIKQESYENAVQVFDAVIKQEPVFCEAAHYYKGAALVQILDFEKRPFKGKYEENYNNFVIELKMAEKLFESHKDACMEASAFVQNLKQNMKNSFITIDAYKKQQETMMTLYDFYIRSIHDIVGHHANKGSFVCQEIKYEHSEKMYESFLKKSVLKQSHIVKARIEDLEELSTSFGIPLELLSSFLETHEGRNIEEQEFLKLLKCSIKMPSLEECWDTLVHEQKLVNEIKCIIIHKSKLTTLQEERLTYVEQAKINIKSSQGRYVFMKQYINSDIEDPFIFEENVLKESINQELYDNFEKENILIFNRVAELSEPNLPSPISLYDHILVKNFTSDNIMRTEAEDILSTLTEKGFLINSSNLYKLASEYDESKLPKIPVYEQALLQILRINFAYRIALQNIQNELKNNPQGQIYVQMISEPHVSLMWEMIGKKIIQPVSVDNHTSNNIGSILEAYGRNTKETKSITNYVKGVLKKFAGSLKSLDTPNFNLVYIIECMEGLQVSPLQELNTFSTNSLDFILKTQEKKYTWKMIRNTIFVTVLGLLELAAGLAIQLFFAGMLSHLGNWLISESLSDLQYAASCWLSGHFDWGHYGRYKLQSMLQSLIVTCATACLTPGLIYSRFGNKLAMSGVIGQSGAEIATLTGKQLIQEVGGKAVAKEFGKQFIVKVGEGLARGLMYESINSLVDSYLQNLFNQLANTLVQDIEAAVNSHGVGCTLEECYKLLGPKEAKERIVHFTENSFSQPTVNSYIITKALLITSNISTICSEATKIGYNMPYTEFVQYLTTFLNYSQYVSHLVDIVASVRRMLDRVDQELKKDIHAAQQRGVKDKPSTPQETQAFKTEVVNQWRNMLKENANTVFSERIAKPVLQYCALECARKGKDLLKQLNNFARNKYHKHIFDTTKKKKIVELEDQSLSVETKKQIIETYHETLAELKSEVRDPELYAEIVMEKGHMDAVCLKATCSYLDRLRGDDATAIKLTVETDSGTTLEYCTSGAGECREINLKLIENHFTNANLDLASNSSDYECLYRSLTHEIAEFKQISMDEFRSQISNEIKTNGEIQNYIKHGKHAFTIRRRIYGGHKDETIAVNKLRTNILKGKYRSVTRKTNRGLGVYLSELACNIKENFAEDSACIFLDNRRVTTASTINNPEVNTLVRVFNFDEIQQRQYFATTTEVRMHRGSLRHGNKICSSRGIRGSRNYEQSTVTVQKKTQFYRRAREVRYTYKRSRSAGRDM